MNAILYPDAVDERARDLEEAGLNGLRLALVTLHSPDSITGLPQVARLEVHFFNTLHVGDILAEITAAPDMAGQIFRVRGGQRIPAGWAGGQVKATAVQANTATSLAVTVEPVGDYSTYTLELFWDPTRIDPFFSTLPFKFRPACFTNDCAPPWVSGLPRQPVPAIDYLAKDYDSFRHVLMAAMAERVPGWRSTSEADLDQVLIDLFAAAADEISDYQDRVINEAYLATARKRVSLARHARLVDYHIHQGNQASSWLAMTVSTGIAPFTLPEELIVWTGSADGYPASIVFATRERRLDDTDRQLLDPLLNRLRLHTWSDAQPGLRTGATSADLVPDIPGAGRVEAERVRDLIRAGRLKRLLVQEWLNPATGRPPGRDPHKRQLLNLIGGEANAETLHDPLTDTWIVRVHWEEIDRLRHDYSFVTFCPTRVEGVSFFHGNLVQVHHGRPVTTHFYEPGTELPVAGPDVRHCHYTRLVRYGARKAVLCTLPDAPLAYLPTPPNGEVPPRSTLHAEVELTGGGKDLWDEVPSLVHCDAGEESGDCFAVETDEHQISVLRFGNGENGRWLPEGAIVHCEYQVGGGVEGNVGADCIQTFRPLSGPLSGAIQAVWNPFDVTDGCDPEPVTKILRNAPEAYSLRQLRAVTLDDYVRRAEEVAGVSRAVARYAWTGSWRTVCVVIDPLGFEVIGDERSEALWDRVRTDVATHLEAVRLTGEDLELRPPRYVPLEIHVALCVDPEYWPEDPRYVLEQELSDSYTPDGRRGFFHPDNWTFGQALHASEILGRIHSVVGIEHVIAIELKRFEAADPGSPFSSVVEVRFDEVIQVQNDPDHLERGFIRLDLRGGRG